MLHEQTSSQSPACSGGQSTCQNTHVFPGQTHNKVQKVPRSSFSSRYFATGGHGSSFPNNNASARVWLFAVALMACSLDWMLAVSFPVIGWHIKMEIARYAVGVPGQDSIRTMSSIMDLSR